MAEHIGPYEVLGELGRGGMGVVYRARHTELGREVALKVASDELQADPESRARFVREAQAAAALAHHPGIVGVHDAGEVEGRLYLAMELVEGHSLADVIDAGDCTPHDAARLVAEAARAVHHAHEAGMLHRDLKPDNVLVDTRGHARVTDFGLVRSAPADAQTARLTQSGMILGTPAYMPPEQATGQEADARADVYALGATLYDALTGFPPFDAESTFELIDKLLREPVAPPSRLTHGLPPDLDAITCKALAKFRGDRYETAAALADDLERFCAGEPVEARMPGVVERASRAGRRNALVLALAGVAVLAGGGAMWMWNRADEAEVSGVEEVARAKSDAEAATAQAERTDRFLAVVRAATDDLWVLIDAFHGIPIPAEEVNAARVRVGAHISRLAEGDESFASGWGALADYYAGDMAGLERLHRLVEHDAGNPELALLRMWCYSVELGEEAKRITYSTQKGGTVGIQGALDEFDPGPWRERIQHDTELVARTLGARPDVSAYLAFARGVDRYLAGEFSAAAEALEAAEALALQGLEASQLRMVAAFRASDLPLAAECAERAAARGWPHSAILGGTALMAIAAEQAGRSNQEAVTTLRRAEALLSRCVDAAPEAPRLRSTRAVIRRTMAQQIRILGGDPFPKLGEMLDDFNWELQRRPDDALLAEQVALANEIMAREEALHGEDPEAHARAALEACDRAARLGSIDSDLLNIRCRVQIIRARWGRFPLRERRAVLAQALEAFEVAGAAGVSEALLGWWLTMFDNRALVAAAGRELWPKLVASALDHSERHLERHPEAKTILDRRVRVLLVAAYADRLLGGDSGPRLAEARDWLDRLFALDPNSVQAFRTLAHLETTHALELQARKQDTRAAWRASLAAYQRAWDLGCRDAGFEGTWGGITIEYLRARRAAGEDVTGDWRTLADRMESAIVRHPKHLSLRTVAFLAWTEAAKGAHPGAVRTRADEAALAHIVALCEARPRNPGYAANAATAYGALGRWDEAVAQMERAVKLNPQSSRYRRSLEFFRRKAGK
jgi:tetratricopeptide (TPR) repeat protein/predicted Ser/Thr protein kinase